MFKILKNQTEVNETRPEKDCCHSSGPKGPIRCKIMLQSKSGNTSGSTSISQKDIETIDSDGREKGEKLIKIGPSK